MASYFYITKRGEVVCTRMVVAAELIRNTQNLKIYKDTHVHFNFSKIWHVWYKFMSFNPHIQLSQFSHSVVSKSLQFHGLQHSRLSCPSPTPWACWNSCPSSWWCHPNTLFSVIPFSSCFQSFPTSGYFPTCQFFASCSWSIGVSASASVLPMSIQDWFPLGLTDWISLQSKGLSRVFSNTTVQKHQFFSTQPSLWSSSHTHTWLLEEPKLWLDRTLWAK